MITEIFFEKAGKYSPAGEEQREENDLNFSNSPTRNSN